MRSRCAPRNSARKLWTWICTLVATPDARVYPLEAMPLGMKWSPPRKYITPKAMSTHSRQQQHEVQLGVQSAHDGQQLKMSSDSSASVSGVDSLMSTLTKADPVDDEGSAEEDDEASVVAEDKQQEKIKLGGRLSISYVQLRLDPNSGEDPDPEVCATDLFKKHTQFFN